MKEQKKCVPEIRFAGFTDDWEQRKLGEIVEIVMGQSPNSGNYTNNPKDHILVQGNADIKNGKVFPRIWTTQITKIGKKNDLIMSVRAPVGDMAKTDYDVVLGRGVCAIKGNEFIYQILSKMKIDGYWNALSTGSTFDAINSNDIKKALISIPKEQEEQTAIGNFFKQLDDTITLHRRNCIKCQNLKMAYLESIFSAKYIHYKDRNKNAWEQRKLGEIVEIVGGGTPDTSIPEYWNGSIDWYSPTEIGNQIYVQSSTKKITSLGLQKSSAKLLPPHRTILFTSRAGIGDMAILVNQGSTNQGFQSFVVDNNIDVYFLYSLGYKIKEYALKNASGSTFLEISKNTLSKMGLFIPSLEEQTAIGNFFKQLDDTIALHQRFWVNNNQFGKEYAELF